MKARVPLLSVILCCAAVAWLNLVFVREIISNQQHEIQEKKRALSSAEIECASVRKLLDETSTALRHSREAEETALRERELFKIESATELTQVRQELERARSELAAINGAVTPDQFAKIGRQVHALQKSASINAEENKRLRETIRKMEIERSYTFYCPGFVPLPAELQGKVVACDPKWQFVVLNVGEEQGARPRGELLVSRNGRLVGWLVIDRVQKNRCIANVKKGWQLAELSEGDRVIPAHPES